MPFVRRRSTILGMAALLACAAFLAFASVTHRAALDVRDQFETIDRHVMVPSPSAARILSMGYTELAADVAWVRLLVYYGDGLVHNTGMPDTEGLVRLINVLDPTFRKAYIWGAYATTFRNQFATQDEYEASVEILRRAVAQFPSDWEFSWVLGLRLFLDVKTGTPEELHRRKEEGAMYIERAMHQPKAPGDLPLLAASIRTALGQKEQALRDLREMILNTEDEVARAKLQARYAALASEAAGRETAENAERTDREWKRFLPYAGRTLYLLVGPPPTQAISLEETVEGATFQDGSILAPVPGP